MRDCFTPVESNEGNRGGHGYFYAQTSTKKEKAATEAQNLWEAFLRVITIISKGEQGMDFIWFFNIYCQKYWQYMWKQEKQLSGYIF